jgi:23S rRNA (adenine1618-N6)-methyltransferase
MWKGDRGMGLGFSDKAVWSRAARRQMGKKEEGDMEVDEEDLGFGFKIYVEGTVNGKVVNMTTVRWIKGHDSVIFESFCGMLKRKLEGPKPSG